MGREEIEIGNKSLCTRSVKTKKFEQLRDTSYNKSDNVNVHRCK